MALARITLIFLALNFFLPPSVHARPQPGNPYGPWNRNLELYESADGKTFAHQGTFVERAGVPGCLQYWSGEILCVFQWFPLDKPEVFDQIALMISRDNGKTWIKPQPVEIKGMPGNLHRAFDPALVSLGDGRLRLYFTSERISPQNRRGNRAIFSALSTDGIHYQFEAGQRFGFPDRETYDVSVFSYKGTLHLFCPVSGKDGMAYHAASKDGLNFSRLVDAMVPGPRVWIGNGLALDEGMRFYGSGPGGVWMAGSKEGGLWQVDEGVNLRGADPAVVQKKDGTFFAVTTGELREDARPGPPPASAQ